MKFRNMNEFISVMGKERWRSGGKERKRREENSG